MKKMKDLIGKDLAGFKIAPVYILLVRSSDFERFCQVIYNDSDRKMVASTDESLLLEEVRPHFPYDEMTDSLIALVSEDANEFYVLEGIGIEEREAQPLLTRDNYEELTGGEQEPFARGLRL